jgi:orotidine-5'-phosphate decarboxylase
MEFLAKLENCIQKNNSLVCVGLDPIAEKLPSPFKSQGVRGFAAFGKALADATASEVCAFKPNSAYFEAFGAAGLEQLEELCSYLKKTHPYIPLILDYKRGDIDRTNEGYVNFYKGLGADAITVNPYMGYVGALEVFLQARETGVIILCRTSNKGAGDLQDLALEDGRKVYQAVAEKVRDEWNSSGNCLLVVGATYPKELKDLRRRMGDKFTFLSPGFGSQGANVDEAIKAGINSNGAGMIAVTASAVAYASSGEDFANAAQAKARELKDQINKARGA